MYIKLVNGNPENYSVGQLRADNPQVSFPNIISDALLAEYDVYPLTPTPYPVVDYTKNVTEGTAVCINGEWEQVWDVTDASAEEVAQRLDDQWTVVRAERNDLLSSCDWTQLPDAPVNAQEWASYRQALRDITVQADPFSIVWPVPPKV